MKIKSAIVVAIVLVLFGALIAVQNPSVTSMIQTYTRDKPDVKLTIGVLKSGECNYKLIGEDSKELKPIEYEYEIGSISKTFTASILCKAVDDGLVKLEDPISNYLPLDPKAVYPTIQSLATHTSGYGEYPFNAETLSEKEMEMVEQDFYVKKLNVYQGIGRSDVLEDIKGKRIEDKNYDWEYSNFGIAVLGTILGDVNGTSYRVLAEDFVTNELGLAKTRLGDGTGNLDNYWAWDKEDAYLASAGFVSTVTDLLKYGQMHLKDNPEYFVLSHKAYQSFKEYGLDMGLGWIIDPDTGYLWHNGGTSSGTSFLGIDKSHQTVVVILSNYPEKDGSEEDGALDALGYTLLDHLSRTNADVLNILE